MLSAIGGGLIVAAVLLLVQAVFFMRRRKYPKLADWHPGKTPDPIAVIKHGKPEWMQPQRAIGLHLVCAPVGKAHMCAELVSAQQACDPDAFWKAWRQCGGSPDVWVDEEGEPFKVG